MFEKFEANFTIAVSVIILAILMAIVTARMANSEPQDEFVVALIR